MERLRDLLVKARLVTEAQVREAEKMGTDHNATLAHVLVRGGVIDSQKLAIFLSKKLGLEFAALNERDLAPAVIERIPFAVANRLRMIPIALRKTREGDEIVIAMSDPTDASARREVEHVVKMRVMALVTDEVGLQRSINKYYEHSPAPTPAPTPAPPPPSFSPSPQAGFPSPQPSPHSPAFNAGAAPPSLNPAAAFQQPTTPDLPRQLGATPHAQGGHPMADALRGITLEGDDDDDALEIVRPGGEAVLVGASLSEDGPPVDFLTESTVDVAQMYAKANAAPKAARPRKHSPLDAIAAPPEPPSELEEHPAAPSLKNSRRIAEPPQALDGPGDFLTPNTEEHMAMVGPPGAGFSQDLSLDEDTAWLRQRLRGELPSETATAASPLPNEKRESADVADSATDGATPPPEFEAPRRAPTLPRDFSGDSSMPSATTPTPPRASGAPTTREVGAPKSAGREKGAPPPAPPYASPLSEESENPTAAYALDEPTHMDAEGKIGAGDTFDLPSLPSDDDMAAAFEDAGPPPRLATDVALEAPNAKDSLPSDSGAVALSQDAMSEEGPTAVDISALGDPKKRRRRAEGASTKVIDYEEVRRKRQADKKKERGKKKAAQADAKDAPKPSRAEVSERLERLRREERTEVVASHPPTAASDASDDESNADVDDGGPLASSVDAQPTVVVAVSSLYSEENTQVAPGSDEDAAESSELKGPIPPEYSDESPTPQMPNAQKKGTTDEETNVTNAPKPREEKTVAAYATVDDPATQLDLSLSQMNMCIVCTRPRLRVALGRALRQSVGTLYLEESVASATKLGRRTDVDVVALIDPEPNPDLSDQLDRLTHRHPDRPLIVVVAALGQSVRVRRAHLRIERPDDDDALPEAVVDAVGQMLDI